MKCEVMPSPTFRSEAGNCRTPVLLLSAFLVGVAATAIFFYARKAKPPTEQQQSPVLSAKTLDVLKGLSEPVELRYYSLLDPQSVPGETKDFSHRVLALISQYERAAGGNLVVTTIDTPSEATAKAASGDRMRAFNQAVGDPCFLGIALSSQGRKETLPLLATEWEPALESDLTRAIVQVSTAIPGSNSVTMATTPDAAILNEVRTALPNLATLSLEQGTRTLRETALRSFSETAKDLQSRLQEAEQRYTETAKNSPEQQAALQEVQRLHNEKTESLKKITAHLQAQIAALEYLKKN